MRIELDEIQALAYKSGRENFEGKVTEAKKLSAEGNLMVKKAQELANQAYTEIKKLHNVIASCHGLEGIPAEFDISSVDGRLVMSWPDENEEEPVAEESPENGTAIPETLPEPVEAV